MTYRQLDYWARTIPLLSPKVQANGSGCYRLFTETDMVRWRLFVSLINAGFKVSAASKLLSDVEYGDIDMEKVVVTVVDGSVRVAERVES